MRFPPSAGGNVNVSPFASGRVKGGASLLIRGCGDIARDVSLLTPRPCDQGLSDQAICLSTLRLAPRQTWKHHRHSPYSHELPRFHLTGCLCPEIPRRAMSLCVCNVQPDLRNLIYTYPKGSAMNFTSCAWNHICCKKSHYKCEGWRVTDPSSSRWGILTWSVQTTSGCASVKWFD